MPILNKSPEIEKMDNRSRIYSILLDKSLTFTEIIEESDLSRATVSKHLSELEEEGVIERAIVDRVRTPVYRLTLDEEKMISELKNTGFDFIVKFVNVLIPGFELFLNSMIKMRVKTAIISKQFEFEGKTSPSIKELEEIADKHSDEIFQDIPKANLEELLNAMKLLELTCSTNDKDKKGTS